MRPQTTALRFDLSALRIVVLPAKVEVYFAAAGAGMSENLKQLNEIVSGVFNDLFGAGITSGEAIRNHFQEHFGSGIFGKTKWNDVLRLHKQNALKLPEKLAIAAASRPSSPDKMFEYAIGKMVPAGGMATRKHSLFVMGADMLPMPRLSDCWQVRLSGYGAIQTMSVQRLFQWTSRRP